MSNRKEVYYWKCDRPSAFYGLDEKRSFIQSAKLSDEINLLLKSFFGDDSFEVNLVASQGNHLAYQVNHRDSVFFLRLENGPDKDDYMNIETEVLKKIGSIGVPSPKVFTVDATRSEFSFAYQILEFIEFPDLNKHYKKGTLDLISVAFKIGENMAKWQSILPDGFGPFDTVQLEKKDKLVGLHSSYIAYYFLNWDKHLEFLVNADFLTSRDSEMIKLIVSKNTKCLQLKKGCLVHKDLALWNILGSTKEIKAFIDWDDTISGDQTDDISLLACFHDGDVISSVIQGYKKVRNLPEDFLPRFWLHLLRNMIVKAVIRVGSGYFEREDEFFLIKTDTTGLDLKEFTKQRIFLAIKGLENKIKISDL